LRYVIDVSDRLPTLRIRCRLPEIHRNPSRVSVGECRSATFDPVLRRCLYASLSSPPASDFKTSPTFVNATILCCIFQRTLSISYLNRGLGSSFCFRLKSELRGIRSSSFRGAILHPKRSLVTMSDKNKNGQKTYHKKATGQALTTVKKRSKENELKLFGSCFWWVKQSDVKRSVIAIYLILSLIYPLQSLCAASVDCARSKGAELPIYRGRSI